MGEPCSRPGEWAVGAALSVDDGTAAERPPSTWDCDLEKQLHGVGRMWKLDLPGQQERGWKERCLLPCTKGWDAPPINCPQNPAVPGTVSASSKLRGTLYNLSSEVSCPQVKAAGAGKGGREVAVPLP